MLYIIITSIIFFLIFLEILNKKNSKLTIKSENIKRIPGLNINRIYSVTSKTGHKQNSKKDGELGWELEQSSHVKVNIKIPYLQDEMSVNYYLNDIGARSNVAKFTNSKIEKYIGFFGCSITYGHGLEEEDTFAAQLKTKRQNYNYLNFAVPGYSTYQSLIKFKKEINKIKFDTIVLGIHKDLERRNTCSISWSKIINNIWGIPSILSYKNASVNFAPRFRLESKKNYISLKFFFEILNILRFCLGSIKFIQKHTMKKILLDFKSLCKKNNIELVIICLEDYNNIYDFLNKNNFNWVASELDLAEKNNNNEYIWQKMPWDNHPNEKANKIYAQKLIEFFNSEQRPFKPNLNKKNSKNSDQEYIYPLW